MKDVNYQNAFGKAPDSFKNRVASALAHMEEEPKMKRFSIRLIVIAAILLILMAGVVYAASTEWRLLDWFSANYQKAPTEKLIAVMNGSKLNDTYEIGEYLVTLEEAVADRRLVYITANVRMKDGEAVYFLPASVASGMSLKNVVGHHFDYSTAPGRPLAYQDGLLEEVGQSSSSDDNRSIRQAAMEEKRRMVNVNLWFTYDDNFNEKTTFTVLPDGSVSFLLGTNIYTEKETVDVELTLVARELDQKGKYVGDTEPKHISFTLPVLPVQETKVFNALDAKVEGADITVDRVAFYMTPLTLHYEIYYHSETEEEAQARGKYYFSFRSAQNERIEPGIGFWASVRPYNRKTYFQTGTLLLEQIPDAFMLRARSIETNESYKAIEVKAK